jgi:DNA helicase HerA-like ATPase
MPFGIKQDDRLSHIYIIGKTGVGKSSLIETLARQDLEAGRGFALIDPHGDLAERVAANAMDSKPDRIAYLNASDAAQQSLPKRNILLCSRPPRREAMRPPACCDWA